MTVQKQIDDYISGQPESKREQLRELHRRIRHLSPEARLWFLDGRNSEGKIVSNPNIGYGCQAMRYADGCDREFYQIGLSANTTGISLYIMGMEDKTYLSRTFAERLGKASVTGYCIKFRKLSDIDIETLEEVFRFGFEARGTPAGLHAQTGETS